MKKYIIIIKNFKIITNLHKHFRVSNILSKNLKANSFVKATKREKFQNVNFTNFKCYEKCLNVKEIKK